MCSVYELADLFSPNVIKLARGLGFEPRLTESESANRLSAEMRAVNDSLSGKCSRISDSSRVA